MLGGIHNLTSDLARLYDANNKLLSDTLKRISTGKKVSSPSDDFVGFARAYALESAISDYETIKEELTEAQGVAQMAVELGDGIYEDLERMKDLAELYNDAAATADDKTAYNAEFKALAKSVQDTIDNNKYSTNEVVSAATIIEVGIDPTTAANKLSVTFAAGDIISDLSDGTWHLDDTSGSGGEVGKTANNVQDEIDKATSYLVKAEGYVTKIERQIDITDTIIASKEAAKSLITDIDEVEEMNDATTLQIRQQATVAMIAQANLSRQSISKLFGGTL